MFIPSNGKVNTIISAAVNDATTSSGPWDLPVQFHDMLLCEQHYDWFSPSVSNLKYPLLLSPLSCKSGPNE